MTGPEDYREDLEQFHKKHSRDLGVMAYPVVTVVALSLIVWAYTFGPLGKRKPEQKHEVPKDEK